MAPSGEKTNNVDEPVLSLARAGSGSYSWLPAARLLAWCLLLVAVSRVLVIVIGLVLARQSLAGPLSAQVVIGVSLEAATALTAGAVAWASVCFLRRPDDRSRRACIRYTFVATLAQCLGHAVGMAMWIYESRQSPVASSSVVSILLGIPIFMVLTAAFPVLAIRILQRPEMSGLENEDRGTQMLVAEASEVREPDLNPPRLPQDQLRGWLRRLPRLTHSLPGTWSWAWLLRAAAWYLIAWGACRLTSPAAGVYWFSFWPTWSLSLAAPLACLVGAIALLLRRRIGWVFCLTGLAISLVSLLSLPPNTLLVDLLSVDHNPVPPVFVLLLLIRPEMRQAVRETTE